MLNILLTRMIVDTENPQFCVQIFVADIEFQDMVHEGGKLSVLYCDVTKTELQKTFQKEDRTL